MCTNMKLGFAYSQAPPLLCTAANVFACPVGVIKYLIQMYDLSAIEFRGASAGALISCLAACQARCSPLELS